MRQPRCRPRGRRERRSLGDQTSGRGRGVPPGPSARRPGRPRTRSPIEAARASRDAQHQDTRIGARPRRSCVQRRVQPAPESPMDEPAAAGRDADRQGIPESEARQLGCGAAESARVPVPAVRLAAVKPATDQSTLRRPHARQRCSLRRRARQRRPTCSSSPAAAPMRMTFLVSSARQECRMRMPLTRRERMSRKD